MFNDDYVLDPLARDLQLLRRTNAFPKKPSQPQLVEEIVSRQATASLRIGLEQRRKISSGKRGQTAANDATPNKQQTLLKVRARSLIQLPPNIDSIGNGFIPFSQLNNKGKLEVKMRVTDFPICREFVKSRPHPMKDLIDAEMMYNKSQVNTIGNLNQELMRKTVNNFESFCRRRLNSLDHEKHHVRVRSLGKKQGEYKPDEITLELNEEVSKATRFEWKPAIGEDSIVVEQDDKVYYLGGRNRNISLPVYNMQTKQWKEIKQPKHSYFLSGTIAHFYNGKFVVFGGEYPIINARAKTLTSKTFTISLTEGIMEELETDGSAAARRCHGSCVFSDYLLVFGGINLNYSFLKEFYALDLVSGQWEKVCYSSSSDITKYLEYGIAKLKCLPVFSRRERMSLYESTSPTTSEYKQEGVYIFGGLNQQGNALSRLLVMTLGDLNPKLIEPKTKGLPPEPRYDYGMCRWRNIIVIHGGRNDEMIPHIYSDCYLLNLTSLYWTRALVSEGSDRCCHELVPRGTSQLWIFGGKDLKGHTKDVTCYNILG